jgi:hypothetical protein
MTYKFICSVHNNQVTITLPPDFSDGKEVTVIVEERTNDRAQKLELLKKAATDPLFLADVKEVSDDFDLIDDEII